MARRDKYGILPPPPVKSKTVVRLRDNQGRAYKGSGSRAIVMGSTPSSSFTRAYGRQVFVCHLFAKGKKANVFTKGAGDLIPVGVAKRIPKVCREALAEYEETYPTLARKKRKRR